MADSVYTFVESTGTVVADTSDLLDTAISDVVEVFGCSEEAASTTSTIMGRLAEQQAAEFKSIALNNAYVINLLNPNLAPEFAFDAIWALTGGERSGATRSSVTLTLTGVADTIIPANSYVQNSSTSTLWYTSEEVTLDEDGNGTVLAYSEDTGEIIAEAETLTQIITATNGWETVTNESAATTGSDEQSLVSAKVDRLTQLSLNARDTLGAVIANVDALDDVAGVVARQNRTSASAVIDNITIPAKSTWLCVDGGDLDEIAEQYAINTYGTAFYGFSNTEEGSYTDPYTGQEYSPVSGQPVYIDRPTEVPIMIEVTASLTSSTDLESQIKLALQDWAAGNVDGYDGAVLGNNISPFEIAAAVNTYFSASSVYVQKVRISKVSDNSLSTDTIEMELYEKATVSNANITVVSV